MMSLLVRGNCIDEWPSFLRRTGLHHHETDGMLGLAAETIWKLELDRDLSEEGAEPIRFSF
jgi:hypothetical protein